MYHSFIKVDQGHRVPEIYLYGVLYSRVHETKIHDISDLQKRLMQIFDFDQNTVNAGGTI